MEYSWLVDKQDTPLGKINREEAHSASKLHRAGVVFVLNSRGEVALAIRSRKKKIYPGCLDSVCSFHVKYGYSYTEAAEEELLDETSIDKEPTLIGKFLSDDSVDRIMVAVFKVLHDGPITLGPNEAESYRFLMPNEADKAILNQKTTSWLPGAWALCKASL